MDNAIEWSHCKAKSIDQRKRPFYVAGSEVDFARGLYLSNVPLPRLRL